MNSVRRAAALSRRNLLVSVLLHVWFAAFAMQLVWRYWESESDRTAEAALIPPGGGGGGGTIHAVQPKEKARTRSRTQTESKRVLAINQPSISFQTQPATRTSSDRMTRRMIAGTGLMGGSGNSIFPGEGGWGAGSGSGFGSGHGGCCPSRKLLATATPADLPAGSVRVIVLDVSPSMRASKSGLANSLAILKQQLAELPEGALFNLVCFAESARSLNAKPIAATPENKADALAFAQESAVAPAGANRTDGTSRLDLGIAAAFSQVPGLIILISDGAPIVRQNGRSLTRPELLQRIRTLLPEDGPRPQFHTAHSGSQENSFLHKLAGEFGDAR